jgi:hypothetical protein
LKVTPDIQPGDVVSIRFAGTPAGETRVQDGFVTADAVQSGATVTVSGHLGADVIKDNTEQRIVEPALVDLVGKRDVRAVPGPLTPAASGLYSSSLEFPTADTFLATYVFEDPDAAGPLTGVDVARVAARTHRSVSVCCRGRSWTRPETGRASRSRSSVRWADRVWADARTAHCRPDRRGRRT